MRAARFRSALAVAVGAHAVIALAVPRPKAPAASNVALPPPELEIVVEREPPAAAPSPETAGVRTPEDSRASALATGHVLVARAASEERSTPEAVVEAPREGEPPPAPAGSSEPWSLSGPAPLDLRVGDYWKSVAMGGASRPSPPAEASTRSVSASDGVARMLHDELEARDVAMGLGAAGPLVTAAHDAMSGAAAPEVGVATLEIDSDANGNVTAARVVGASANPSAWNRVAQQIVRLMASKPLRVSPGSRGVRARLRIVAERTLPAGEARHTSAGAVPDDIPGGDQPKVCDTTGEVRRCNAGVPAGVTGTLGDLSNIGAKRSRSVHVQLLGESSI